MTIQFRDDVTVELVKANASDQDVAMAARVSTLGLDAADSDRPIEGLINFLARDRHGSPFEHASLTFRVHAPIVVAREAFRHRAGWSYNEASGRYMELKPVFYVPSRRRNLTQVGKPGQYRFKPGSAFQHFVSRHAHMLPYRVAWLAYKVMLKAGIAREVARNVLPVGTYTTWYATCNARSLMHFLGLRTIDERAKFPSFPQQEIEMVASGMEDHFAELMPITHEAYNRNGRVAP